MDNNGAKKGLYVLIFAFSIAFVNAIEVVLHHDKKVPNSCNVYLPRYTLSIKYWLNDGSKVIVHCKSKDDDIGSHELYVGQSISFSFHPQIFNRTFFWCDTFWKGQWKVFDAYVDRRDYDRCYKNDCQCNWYITDVGPCFKDEVLVINDKCDGWRK